MLGKLIKYEFKATARNLLPVYIALMVLSIITKIFWGVNGFRDGGATVSGITEFIRVMSMFLYVIIFIAAIVMTVVIIIQRFYKNLLKDEGYLMNTLPVTPAMNIASKLITSIIGLFICSLVSVFSIMLLAYYPGMINNIFDAMGQIFREGIGLLGGNFYLFAFEILMMMLISTIMSILMMYTSMIIGHLANKRKILLSFGVFIVLHMILNIIGSFLMVILASTIKPAQPTFINCQMAFGTMFLMMLIFSIIFFFVSSYIMKNKLNLE